MIIKRPKRFPLVIQRDSAHCGVACIEILCKYYGNDVRYDEILDFCRTGLNGMSFRQIKATAEHFGLLAKSVKLSVPDLKEANGICILHWNQNHYVVLYKVKGDSFYVADPSKGKIRCSHEDLEKHWCDGGGTDAEGYAMFLEPAGDFYAYKTVRSYNGNSLKLSVYAKKYIRPLFLVFVTLLLTGGFLSLLPFLTQKIVDTGINGKDFGFVLLVLCGQFALTMGKVTFDFIRKWILLKISMRINVSMVGEFLVNLVKLPMWQIETKHIGDLQQRLYDHTRINAFLTAQIPNVVYSLVLFLIFSGVLLVYNAAVYSVFAIFSILYALWMVAFMGKRRIIDYEYFDRQSLNNIKVYQYISNLQEIKLQNCEERRCAEWKDAQSEMFSVQTKSLKLQQVQEMGNILINESKNLLMTAFTAYAVIKGNITLGGMMAIQYMIGQLNGPVEQLMGFIYSFQDVKISMERINEVRNQPAERQVFGDKEGTSGANADLTVSDMSFSYDRLSGKNTLKGINLRVAHGKVTAIVGASGSGKTTLLKILLGYYMPSEGNVYVGENELKSYNVQWWRRQCGVVMQDGVVFSDTIARNISIEGDDIDYYRLERAIKLSKSSDFIDSLPLGYNTKVGQEGISLSKGQAQRILIARAIYKDADYLFLDEATNSLDARNESEIVSNLSVFFKEKTVVVIAHRLSTVKNADCIIVMDGGRIVESGKHDDLLRLHGYYYDLIKSQLDV